MSEDYENEQKSEDYENEQNNEDVQSKDSMEGYEQYVPIDSGTAGVYVDNWEDNLKNKQYDVLVDTYDGEFNGTGQRHGQGTCTNGDGSIYTGPWEYNLKHGEGELKFKDGFRFEGTFVKGKRNGTGILFYPNGNAIEANWANDMMNGEGTLYKMNGQQIKCLFYNNFKIELSRDQSEGCYDNSHISLLLSIGCWLMLILFAVFLLPPFIIIGLFFFIGNIVEFQFSNTKKYLQKIVKQSELLKQLGQMRMNPPKLKFVIRCYHYESYIDKEGRSRKREVVTHSAEQPYRFSQWTDTSNDIFSTKYISNLPIIRLEVDLNYNFSPEAHRSYQWQRREFFRQHIMDKRQDKLDSYQVDGYVQKQLVINDMGGVVTKSRFFDFYTIFSIVGLSWLVRILFIRQSKRVEYSSDKLFIS